MSKIMTKKEDRIFKKLARMLGGAIAWVDKDGRLHMAAPITQSYKDFVESETNSKIEWE